MRGYKDFLDFSFFRFFVFFSVVPKPLSFCERSDVGAPHAFCVRCSLASNGGVLVYRAPSFLVQVYCAASCAILRCIVLVSHESDVEQRRREKKYIYREKSEHI